VTTRYIAETKWRVQLQTGAPTNQTFEKVLDAPSDLIAIRRAQAAYPNVQFVNSQATQVDQQGGAPMPGAGSNTPNGTGLLPGFRPLQPLRQLNPGWPTNVAQAQATAESRRPINPERFIYPYSITMPQQFATLLKETAPVSVFAHDGQHTIVLENADEMRQFLGQLSNHPNRKGVKTIIAGVRSSIV
jgi:hypothetical protein